MLGVSLKTPLTFASDTNIKSTVKAMLQAAVILFMWIISY